MTVDDADVDFDWCVLNGDTCCARCQAYLTTTVPTTTLPAECPNGNTLDSCNIRVSTIICRSLIVSYIAGNHHH